MKKVFVAHASSYDYKNELYAPLRSSFLNNQYDFFLPKERSEDEVITRDIIKNSHVILAEVSYPSTGQGIELGWADMFGVPIVCFYKQGRTYSKALSKLTNVFVEYNDEYDMIEKLQTAFHLLQ